MILTITLTLTALIALNFILLFTSCNKTSKKKVVQRPHVIKKNVGIAMTNQLPPTQLAATGS
ncbi:hypothetical protein OE09_1516 [Flavobacteriaceae bacterium MAR_2010_72]|nr:hypothetical protein OE09_1516 [Flavobacteriaceae bacterium MAR_2010_72]TVZ59761.1 hypothetical protein NA63_2297 [Flavobacteriaceae bacterium MAR_2010_105]